MPIRLVNGDYQITPEGDLREIHGIEALLQDAMLALKAKRNRFYPDKEFGSRLYRMDGEPLAALVTAYAVQALDRLDGAVAVRSCIDGTTAIITLLLNGKERQVSIDLNDYL